MLTNIPQANKWWWYLYPPTQFQRMGSLKSFLKSTSQHYCLYYLNHYLTKRGRGEGGGGRGGGRITELDWERSVNKLRMKVLFVKRGKRKKGLPPNGREIPVEGKTKRQPETKARWITFILKGTQRNNGAKWDTIPDKDLLCSPRAFIVLRVPRVMFYLPRKRCALYFMRGTSLCLASRLLRFKPAIVVLYLWSALKIWKALSLQEERKAFVCDSDRSCLSPLADILALCVRPQIFQITRCSSCSSVPLCRGQGTCRGTGLPVS